MQLTKMKQRKGESKLFLQVEIPERDGHWLWREPQMSFGSGIKVWVSFVVPRTANLVLGVINKSGTNMLFTWLCHTPSTSVANPLPPAVLHMLMSWVTV